MSAIGAISMSATMRSRKWWVALALLALAFMSMRPACEAWLSHGGADLGAAQALVVATQDSHAPHDAACCAGIEDSKLVKPADYVLTSTARDAPVFAPYVAWVSGAATQWLRRAPRAAVIPPGIASFYERSARILR